jgi:putative Mn2+ efflux pump MntP
VNFIGEYLPAVLIGVSLSMDAFAVSVGSGVSIPGLKFFHALRASFFFGLFQFLMPVAGWLLGNSFASLIGNFDHWVVFGLLSLIGGKMILESLKAGKAAPGQAAGPGAGIRNIWTLLSISLATSIDALAVGVSFSLLDQGIWRNALIIGGVTFCCCLAGFEFGRRLGRLFERWAGVAGGVVLIGVGARVLLEHLLTGN